MVDKTTSGYRRALFLVIMFGLISLFSDLTYQAGAVLGPLGMSVFLSGTFGQTRVPHPELLDS